MTDKKSGTTSDEQSSAADFSHDGDQHNYIRRGGRLTAGQARSLSQLTDRYVVHNIPAPRVSARELGIEIGFGMGHALVEWADRCPDWDLFGIELYQPGVGALMSALEVRDLKNVQIIQRPAQLVLAELGDQSVHEIRIYFPDPWPKKRHAKRRLIQPEFAAELARVLCSEGLLRVATDWMPYAEWMRECFAPVTSLRCELDETRLAEQTQGAEQHNRPVTKFEARGQRLGHEIVDLVYCRQ